MERRTFLEVLTGSLLAAPLAAEAQQSDRVRRIGVLMGFAENDEVWQAYLRPSGGASRNLAGPLAATFGLITAFQANTPNARAPAPVNWSRSRRM